MRYFFDLLANGIVTLDHEGTEFHSLTEVMSEARRALTAIVAHEVSGADSQQFRISVRDSERPVYSLGLSLEGSLIPATGAVE